MNLDQDLQTMLRERAESVVATPVVPERTVRRVRVRKTLSAAAAMAVMAAVATTGTLVLKSTVWTEAAPVLPADQTGQESEQGAVIRHVVDAINARDTDAFVDVFTSDGSFSPRGTFRASSGIMNNDHPVADAHLVKAWMALHEAWDLEVDLIACDEADRRPVYRISDTSDLRVHCEVATRWHTLSLEIRERWVYEFDGTKLVWLQLTGLLDLNPSERDLPLGYDGLEAWEEWLKAHHPGDAARYLNQRITGPPRCDGCREAWNSADPRLAPLLWPAKRSWSINGWEFEPNGLVPYDPKFADEIEVSIQAFLNDR